MDLYGLVKVKDMTKSSLLLIILVFSTATLSVQPSLADEASTVSSMTAAPAVTAQPAQKANREHHGYVSITDEVAAPVAKEVDPNNLSAALTKVNPSAQATYDAIANANDLALIQMPSACPSQGVVIESTSAVALTAEKADSTTVSTPAQ